MSAWNDQQGLGGMLMTAAMMRQYLQMLERTQPGTTYTRWWREIVEHAGEGCILEAERAMQAELSGGET